MDGGRKVVRALVFWAFLFGFYVALFHSIIIRNSVSQFNLISRGEFLELMKSFVYIIVSKYMYIFFKKN